MLNTPSPQNDPMIHLDDAQKEWIRNVVQRDGAEVAGRIYGGPFAVDRFGRDCIKELFGVDVPERTKVSPVKIKEAKPRALKPKKARKKKSAGAAKGELHPSAVEPTEPGDSPLAPATTNHTAA